MGSGSEEAQETEVVEDTLRPELRMSYYILWSPQLLPGDATRDIDGGNWGGLDAGDFIEGRKLVPGPSIPIHINIFEDDVGDMPPVFVVPALVVRRDFAEALSEIGVDNIDFYPAVLHDRKRDQQWDDYFVGNVIGMVDAIDTAKSVLDPDSPPAVAKLFETMAIDESKSRDLRLFRLMHKPSSIVVSQEVRDHLMARRFRYVQMISPESFA